MVIPSWTDVLLSLLCDIYKEWGGNCADLPVASSARVQSVVNAYAVNGAPKFGSESLRQAYLATLTDLETHLDLSGNDLSTEDNAALRNLIEQLRSDLTPP